MDDRDRLAHRTAWVPWAVTSVALVLVAFIAYMIGAQHQVVVDGDSARHVWVHSGFPGFWLFFLIWILFGGLRRMWWGWGSPCGPWRYRGYYRHPYDVEDERDTWEEWHRRAHNRMDTPGGGAPGSSTANRGPIT